MGAFKVNVLTLRVGRSNKLFSQPIGIIALDLNVAMESNIEKPRIFQGFLKNYSVVSEIGLFIHQFNLVLTINRDERIVCKVSFYAGESFAYGH